MAEKFDNAMLVKTFFIHKQKINYFSTKRKFSKTKHQYIVNQQYKIQETTSKFSFFISGGRQRFSFFRFRVTGVSPVSVNSRKGAVPEKENHGRLYLSGNVLKKRSQYIINGKKIAGQQVKKKPEFLRQKRVRNLRI
ncbi:MAG: hypothetical protein J1E02_06485 [Coprobacter sp.]|nr:hypothetical protein [Coprobacter sp.]